MKTIVLVLLCISMTGCVSMNKKAYVDNEMCSFCRGTGLGVNSEKCRACGGTGWIKQ